MTHPSSSLKFLLCLMIVGSTYGVDQQESEVTDIELREHHFQDAFTKAFQDEIAVLAAQETSTLNVPAPLGRWGVLKSYLNQNPIYQKVSTGVHWFKEWFHWRNKMTPNSQAVRAQELVAQYPEWRDFANYIASSYEVDPLAAKTLQLCEAYWTAHADLLPVEVQESVGMQQPIWMWPLNSKGETLFSLLSGDADHKILHLLGITDILKLAEDSLVRHQVLQAKDLYENLLAASSSEERLNILKSVDESFDGGLGRLLVVADNWKLFTQDDKALVADSKGHADELIIRISEHILGLPSSDEVNKLRASWLAEALMTGLIEGRIRAFAHIWSLMPESLQNECAALTVADFAHPALVSSYEITNRIKPNLAQKLKTAYDRLGPVAHKASPFFLSLWRSLSDIAYQSALKRTGMSS